MTFDNDFGQEKSRPSLRKMGSLFDRLTNKRSVMGIGAGAIALYSVVSSPFNVDQSEMGVVTRNGKFARVAEPGLNFKIPFLEDVTRYPGGIVTIDAQGNDLNTLTVDTQQIANAKLRIQFRLPHDEEGLRRFRQETRSGYLNLMETDGINAFKEVAGKFNSLDLAGKREDLVNKTRENLTRAAFDKYGIKVVDVRLSDVNLTGKYMDAVEKAAIEKTLVEQARLAQQKEQIMAETAKIKAAGIANGQIEAARGEAEGIRLKAEAEARRINLEGDALARNPNLVELRRVEAWSAGGAQVPQVISIGSAGPAPFMSLFPNGPAVKPAASTSAPAPGK